MRTAEQLKEVFYAAIEKENRTKELTSSIRNDILDVTSLLGQVMEEMGWCITRTQALVEVKDE